MLDDEAVDLFSGKLTSQTAFMQGKLKIKGNMQAAMRFTPELSPKGNLGSVIPSSTYTHWLRIVMIILVEKNNLAGNPIIKHVLV